MSLQAFTHSPCNWERRPCLEKGGVGGRNEGGFKLALPEKGGKVTGPTTPRTRKRQIFRCLLDRKRKRGRGSLYDDIRE